MYIRLICKHYFVKPKAIESTYKKEPFFFVFPLILPATSICKKKEYYMCMKINL